ncbi:MAG: hypothetical protein GF365_03545 [Candidatus Buchananbacteria bacterium]|nr:hypothetical protein [Candidatus Buchananbacteria bacterium]
MKNFYWFSANASSELTNFFNRYYLTSNKGRMTDSQTYQTMQDELNEKFSSVKENNKLYFNSKNSNETFLFVYEEGCWRFADYGTDIFSDQNNSETKQIYQTWKGFITAAKNNDLEKTLTFISSEKKQEFKSEIELFKNRNLTLKDFAQALSDTLAKCEEEDIEDKAYCTAGMQVGYERRSLGIIFQKESNGNWSILKW